MRRRIHVRHKRAMVACVTLMTIANLRIINVSLLSSSNQDIKCHHRTRGRIVREKVHICVEDYLCLRTALHRGPTRHQL